MTKPPEQTGGTGGGTGGEPRPSMGMPGIASGATLPIPGNAEFLLLVVVEIVFILIWIIAKSVNTQYWVTVTTVLVSFYFVSRGIAKASRVLEQ
jgi:hypothetical protein